MRLKNNISKKQYIFRGFLGFLCFFILWSLLTYSGLIKSFFLPSPTETIAAILNLFFSFNLLSDIGISLYRIFGGFLVAVIVAVPLGVLVGTSKKMEAYIEPLVAFVRYIPSSAFVPLSILWFGVGDSEKFFMIFLYVAPYILIMVADAVAKCREEFIEVGYTLGASRGQILTKIIIPYSLPEVWDSIRIMFGAAWTLIVLVEMIAATSGLGFVIIQSQRFLQTANVIAIIIVIGLLGLATDYLFKLGYSKFFPWSEKTR